MEWQRDSGNSPTMTQKINQESLLIIDLLIGFVASDNTKILINFILISVSRHFIGGFVSKKTQEITLILEIALVQNPPNNYENTLNL